MYYQAIVNALIPPRKLPCSLQLEKGNVKDVRFALLELTPHYIRHPATARLLGKEPNDGFYEPKMGDKYLVIRLKPGVAQRGTEVDASWEDLEIIEVTVN